MAVTAPDFQALVDASDKRVEWYVFISGKLTTCREVNVRHGVYEPIGSCTLTIPLPLPTQVVPDASLEVQAGYAGNVATIFKGTLPARRLSIDANGALATMTGVSANARIADKDYTDVEYKGPISLRDLFQAMAKRRKVASFFSDATVYPNGTTEIRLGNTKAANDRAVKVPRKTASLHFLNDIANLFGYYVFDTPQGLRQKLVAGMPSGTPALTVQQAWNAISLESTSDTADVVSYWEVFGARYTDPDQNGMEVAIRSIPATVPPNYTRDERQSELLDTIGLADAVRNRLEIDRGAPTAEIQWTTHGAPHLMPGDVVNVTAPMIGATGLQWVMSVEHSLGRDGFTTTCRVWRGAGVAVAAGQDCITTTIPGGPWHLGDEYVAWYAKPQGSGKEVTIPFTVLENFSNITVLGIGHGTNSQFIDNKNADLEISRFEIWQGGEKIGSGNLPVLNEDYAKQINYSDRSTWPPLVIPISGTIKPGNAELKIIAGENRDLPAGTRLDDFEVDRLSLRTCGVGEPVVGVAA